MSRVTQVPIHVPIDSLQPGRVTQVAVHVPYLEPQPARVTQVPIHVTWNFPELGAQSLTPISPATETWMWNTTLTKSIEGFEQRMELRTNPLVTMEVNFAIQNETDRRVYLETLHEYIGKRVNFPQYQYSSQLVSVADAGGTALAFDPLVTDVRVGEQIAVFNSDLSVLDYYTVSTVNANGCVTTEQFSQTYNTGFFVAPAPSCRVIDNQSMSMMRYHGTGGMVFEFDLAREIRRPNQNVTLTTINSIPLVDANFVTGGGVSEGMSYNVMSIEAPSIDTKDFRLFNHPQWLSNRIYQVEGRNLDYWRQLASAIRGSLKPFFLPTFREDISLSAVPSLGGDTLITTQKGLIGILAYATNRRVLITTANGSSYNQIIDVREQEDRTIELQLATALGSNAGDNVIERISFVQKVRIADDKMVITHTRTNTTISFTTSSVLETD